MEITFQIENSFFGGAIDLGKHIRVDVLKNFLVTGQVVFQFLVIILVFVHKISDDFYYFWLKHVFTVQIDARSFFPCKYACKNGEGCTPSKTCRSSRACFCPPIFCPTRTDLGFWSRASRHQK